MEVLRALVTVILPLPTVLCSVKLTVLLSLIGTVRREVEVTKLFNSGQQQSNIYRAELLLVFAESSMALMDVREPLIHKLIQPVQTMPLF